LKPYEKEKNMSRRTLFIMLGAFLIAILLTVKAGYAQESSTPGLVLPYSGRLADAAGQPVADGLYDFIFALYPSAKAEAALWSETQSKVSVKAGELNVILGQNTPLSEKLVASRDLWLSVSVRAPQEIGFTRLNPRQSLDGPAAVNELDCPHSHFTDSWSGADPEWGLFLENTSTGDGLRAYSRSTVWNYAALFGANIASTGYGTGVYGYSDLGVGVYANSGAGDGLEATTASTTKSAIYAHATNSNGVWAISTNKQGVHGGSVTNFGVEATGGGDTTDTDPIGDLLIGGARGEVFAPGSIMELFTNGYMVIDLDNDNNSNNQFEIWNGSETLVYKVDEAGNTTATGAKSAVVSTPDYGQRLMYAVESPEVWFEDFGSAQLAGGAVFVPIEPIFAETLDLQASYHVFVTPLCEEPVILFVSEKTPAGFTVEGVTLDNQPSQCPFDYHLVAKRLGYADKRLSPVDYTADSKSQGLK
jgi:hypothetical protein